jgi:ABC-type multidrug transport system ATPase subunit
VLVLDEPTNHLDLEAIEALVDALAQYEGTLLFVSHDRWFVSQLANRIVEIHKDGVRDYQGGYDDYLEKYAAKPTAPPPAEKTKAAKEPQPEPTKRRAVRRSASTRA